MLLRARWWSVAVLTASLLGCSTPEAPHPPSTESAEIPVGTGVARAADGLEIAYTVRGEGETALVFVHGWSCSQEFWREQAGPFALEHEVVTVDLGGHGLSGTDREPWSILELAGDVVAVADALQLERIVLIGHSMGGPVSLEAARLMPGRVLGVVAVDTLHDVEVEIPRDFVEKTAPALRADFAGTMAGFFAGMGGPELEEDLRAWLVDRASAADPDVAIALLEDFPELDLPVMLRAAAVPVRAINAAQPETKIEAGRRHGDFDAVILPECGHFLHLEKPEEFNALLREQLESFEGAATATPLPAGS